MTFHTHLKLEKKRPDHEAIFLDHYDWLLSWARQLTQGVVDEAEDLVQDLYVRFLQRKSGHALEDDDQVRAYLYSSLRNLFISRKLRNGRDAVSGLLAVDFDSVAFAVSAVDRSQLLHVRSDLAGICEYACLRRRTSRAGSVLILRFFLGFLTTEVMALLRAGRSSVDTSVETARLEAKAYLSRPNVLRFLGRSERKSLPATRYLPERPEALFAELERRIFSEVEGKCFPAAELKHRYGNSKAVPFTTLEVAHLASCRTCLNLAAELLGLHDLARRTFEDGEPPERPGSSSGVNGDDALKKLRRKLRETFEHRPKKLQIVVDGEVKSVLAVTSASSNLQMALPRLSQPGFVEVLSEQGRGLLYFDLQQDKVDVPAARVATVDLSDARQLSVTLTLSCGSPLIEVTYYDPLLEQDAEDVFAPQTLDRIATSDWDSREKNTFKSARWRVGNPFAPRHWLPMYLTCLAGFGIVCASLLATKHLYPKSTSPLSPQRLLSDSIEHARLRVPPRGAIHQVFSFEVRSAKGKMIANAEIDTLRGAERPLQRLRLRETGGRFVASHRIDASGQAHDQVSHTRIGAPRSTERWNAMWQHVPDASDFLRLTRNENAIALHSTPEGYEVSLTQMPYREGPWIVEAHLILSSGDLRPISETLRVREGVDTTEYRFRETRFEVLDAPQVDPRAFESDLDPDASKLSGKMPYPAHTALEALTLLSHQPQDIQDAIDIERRADGTINVTGVLPTNLQARSLSQAFRALATDATLQVRLHSSEEAEARRTTSGTEFVLPVTIEVRSVPLNTMLQDALSTRHGIDDDLDEHVSTEARNLVEAGARIDRFAWMVEQVGALDFSRNEIARMNLEDRALWLASLDRPLKLCDVGLRSIESILVPTHLMPTRPTDIPLATVGELQAASTSFRQNAERLDKFLRDGFAISNGVPSSPVRPAELLAELAEVQSEERRLETTIQHLQRATQ